MRRRSGAPTSACAADSSIHRRTLQPEPRALRERSPEMLTACLDDTASGRRCRPRTRTVGTATAVGGRSRAAALLVPRIEVDLQESSLARLHEPEPVLPRIDVRRHTCREVGLIE